MDGLLFLLLFLVVTIVLLVSIIYVLIHGWPKLRLLKRKKEEEEEEEFVECPFCRRPVLVKRNDKGFMEGRCPYKKCGGYLRTGTRHIKSK